MKKSVTLTVTVTDPEMLTRTVESFGRALAGLTLEGIEPMLYVTEEEATE